MMTSPSVPNQPLSELLGNADMLARVFTGLSDPTRLRLLLLVLDQERHVNELVSLVGASQGRVSTHLQCLRWCGFVSAERRGKYVYYRVTDPRVRQLLQLAQGMVVLHGQQLASCDVLRATDAARRPDELTVEVETSEGGQ